MKKLIQLKNKENENLDPINNNYEKRIKTLEDNVYSTNEVRIGTWTDGKPLYRKVVTATTPSKGSDWINIAKISNDINIKKIQALLGGYLPIPLYITVAYYAIYQIVNGNIQMNVAGYTNNSVEFIIEYTKN